MGRFLSYEDEFKKPNISVGLYWFTKWYLKKIKFKRLFLLRNLYTAPIVRQLLTVPKPRWPLAEPFTDFWYFHRIFHEISLKILDKLFDTKILQRSLKKILKDICNVFVLNNFISSWIKVRIPAMLREYLRRYFSLILIVY